MILDTSFLIALHSPADRFHAQASRTDLFGDRLLIPAEVWVEFCEFIGLRASRDEATVTLENVRKGPFAVESLLDHDQIADIALRLRSHAESLALADLRPLTLTDAVVCELASRFRESVLTFDRGMMHAIQEGLFPGARLG